MKPLPRLFRQLSSLWPCMALFFPMLAATLAQQPEPGADTLKKLFDATTIGSEAKYQGEYVGTLAGKPVAAQVVARGDRCFHALVLDGGLPGEGWNAGRYLLLESEPLAANRVAFHSAGDDGASAVLEPSGFTLKRSGKSAVLRRVERKSPTLGLAAPAGATVLFDARKGTASLAAFEARKDIEGLTTPTLYEGYLMAGAVTKQRFTDYSLHAEFFTGFEPENIPWRRADSGIYLHSSYEVAIGDSFGFDFDLLGSAGPTAPKFFCSQLLQQKFEVFKAVKHPSTPRICGTVFTYPSRVPNSCLPPLVWQTLDIDFKAPRFDGAGAKLSDAVISVKLNGHVTVDQQGVPRPTPHGFKTESGSGPIWFEAFGRRVLYRNIWLVEKK
jgi:hypothetical protein